MNLESGYYYHIYNRGNNSKKIFYKKENYLFFIEKMKEYLSPFVSIIAWCLLPNHFHFVVFVHRDRIKIINNPSHAMTSRHSKTTKKDKSHTITKSDSMTMTTEKNICIIGIGSNIKANTNIPKMLTILKENVTIIKTSAFIKTKPIGIVNQPDFTNGAVKIQTNLDLKNLNKLLKKIEDQLGRIRTGPKSGPRCIDLDIVVWNGKIIDEDYYTRDFLQMSVSELTE